MATEELPPASPDPAPGPESRVLIARAQAGSAEALGELLEQYRAHLFALAARDLDPRLRARESPSDVVQQTFLEARRDFPQFRGHEPGQLQRWLEQILRSTLEDLRGRHARRRRQVDRDRPIPDVDQPAYQALAADSPLPPEKALSREEQEQLTRALDKLPEDLRSVIEMRTFQQLPFPRIAEAFQISEDAARMRWYRAVDALRQEMTRGHEPD